MNTHIFKLLQFFLAAPPTPYFGKIRQEMTKNGNIRADTARNRNYEGFPQ
jgi:hypothetical protein